ncbi:MAG: YlxR family protein [Candidatus Dormibacteria bacterium]
MGCRRRRPQAELLRFHLAGDRLEVDGSGHHSPGRGAYLCAKMECWRAAVKRQGFQRGLRSNLAGLDQGGLGDALAGIIANSALVSAGEEKEEPR